MNLGGMEEIAKEVAGRAMLDHAKETERKLDETLSKLDKMEEDDFDKLREKRKAQLMAAQRTRQENLTNGHGRYTELPDQPAFFEASKRSKWMVVHFYRPTTTRCQIADAHLERLAPKHLETRFCKINAEKCPYLTEKLNVFVIPTILLVDKGQAVHQCYEQVMPKSQRLHRRGAFESAEQTEAGIITGGFGDEIDLSSEHWA